MGRKITVRGVILDNMGKLYCVRLKSYGGKDERTFWCAPGGGIDAGESLHDALRREMIEETGVTPVIGNLLYVQQFAFEGEEQLEFFFHVKNFENYKDIDIATASHAEEEIAEHGFVDPKTTHILPEFLINEDITQQINNNLPTKLFNYL